MTNAQSQNTSHELTYDRDADGQYINIRCRNCGVNMEDPADFPCPKAPEPAVRPLRVAGEDPWATVPALAPGAPF